MIRNHDPECVGGVELLHDRVLQARRNLTAAVSLHEGDALALDIGTGSLDVMLVSTVFSSRLDRSYQRRLATSMWRWIRPGFGVLWHGFTRSNPGNVQFLRTHLRCWIGKPR